MSKRLVKRQKQLKSSIYPKIDPPSLPRYSSKDAGSSLNLTPLHISTLPAVSDLLAEVDHQVDVVQQLGHVERPLGVVGGGRLRSSAPTPLRRHRRGSAPLPTAAAAAADLSIDFLAS